MSPYRRLKRAEKKLKEKGVKYVRFILNPLNPDVSNRQKLMRDAADLMETYLEGKCEVVEKIDTI
jgi:hypothetical protein